MPTTAFGTKMKEQVEERLTFLTTGEKTRKNVDLMKEVLDELKEENLYSQVDPTLKKRKKKSKKAKKQAEEEEEEEPVKEPAKKKKKKVEAD